MRNSAPLGPLAALLLGVCACSDGESGSEPTPDASVDAGAGRLEAGPHAVGPFVVTLGEDNSIRVSHSSLPERVVLATRADFVEAWAVDDDISEFSGSFTIEEDVRTRCAELDVDGAYETDDGIELRATLSCEGESIPAVLAFSPRNDSSLGFSLRISPKEGSAFNEAVLVLEAAKDERFVGFGEQFSYVDVRGRVVPILVQEGGIGRAPGGIADNVNVLAPGAGGSYFSTYAPMPFFMTDRGRSLLLENEELSWFDLTADDRATVRVRGVEQRGVVLFGDEPLDIIEALTEHTGRMRPLPDWLNRGAVVGMQGGTERVREVLADLEALDTPLAAFWLQDWVGKRQTPIGSRLWWNWQLNEMQYPGFDQLVADLAASDVRMMTYINPYLVDVQDDPAFTRNLYEEARAMGFLVQDKSGMPYVHVSGTFEAGVVDLTNPDAVAWLSEVVREELLGVGASGYMADFGEALPFDAVLASGEDPAVVHNRYPELWAKLNRDVVEGEDRLGDVVFFTRSGYTTSAGLSTLFWVGDQMVNWDGDDGMASALKGILSGGLSGISLNHADIGGYTAWGDIVRTPELLARWIEWSAFTPVYRTHEGNQPDGNAQIYDSPEALATFAKFAKMYAALAPYRKKLMTEAAKTGAPLVRHLLLEAPDDPKAWDQHLEFMLGSDVLVAPVFAPGEDKVSAYLPAGEWVHLWSGDAFDQAGSVEVDAPLGEPAVFYRKGSDAGKALEGAKAL